MKFTLGLCFSLALAAGAAAQPTGRGPKTSNLTGRVQNIVTGLYLSNARIIIKGGDQVALTDNAGYYNLTNVPSGAVVLQVSYTDLDTREISLTLPPGQTVRQDVGLTSVARYGRDTTTTVKLDPFLVGSQRETDAEAIAISEQRYAPNIKNVISTDAMGDMVGGSVGEFLKYLPGLTANYDAAEVSTISIRGIGSGMTGVETDGLGHVNGGVTLGRAVGLIPMPINQIARIDVTKVPTPSTAADSLAGSINMISKTVFERDHDELRIGAYLNGNFKAMDVKRTPHPYWDNMTYKILPGFDFDYAKKLTNNFGVILTAMSTASHTEFATNTRVWNAAGTGTGASFRNPYLQTAGIFGSKRGRMRSLYGFRADWRLTPHSVLTFGARKTKSISARNGRNTLTFNVGTNGTPTPSGVALSFGPDFTEGPTGRGAVTLDGTSQFGNIDGVSGDAHYRFDNGQWKLNASYNYAAGNGVLNPPGTFSAITAVVRVPNRVSFANIPGDGTMPRVRVLNNTNQEIDYLDIDNYRMTTATEGSNTRNGQLTRSGKIDLGRRLGILPFPATVQVGTLQRVQSREQRADRAGTWNFVDPNHSPVPYVGQNYSLHESYKFPLVPALSTFHAAELFHANPALLTQTVAQQVAAETSMLNSSQYAQESVKAYYLQGEVRLMNNRLNLLTGVRYEGTDIEGQGTLNDQNLVFVRNSDGSFARTPAGARIRKPEAGAPGSLEEARFVRKERGYAAERTYDGYYPSLHVTYNVTDDFVARAAYARTYGRPNFTDIIPSTTINEADLDANQLDNPDIVKGTITVSNTGLKPWTAHNFDLSAEYYTKEGGVFSAGVFRKDITDFFGTSVRLATSEILQELDLDSRYLGWNVSSTFNSGDARISGVEINGRHSLRPLGGWGRYFTVFANATRLRLEGNPFATFTTFVPKSASWGFSYNWKRVTVMPKWTYRGLVKGAAMPALGPDAFEYTSAFTIMDINIVYRLRGGLSLTCSVNNVFNAFNARLLRYGSETPAYAYARQVGEYGPAFSIGVKGSF